MSKEFDLGRVIVTDPVRNMMNLDQKFSKFVQLALGRHSNLDWGRLSAEEKQKNDEALASKGKIVSVYKRPGMQKDDPMAYISIITEEGHKQTTIIFEKENV